MIETSMKGFQLNPGGILDASDYMAKDAEIVTDSSYFNGTAVKATGPGKAIFDSGWIPAGTLVENVNIMPVWAESNINTTVQAEPNVAMLIITKRLHGTDTIITTNTFPIQFRAELNGTGTILREGTQNTVSNLFLWFGTEYDYKIEIVTGGNMTTSEYVILDAVRIERIFKNSVTTPGQAAWLTPNTIGGEAITQELVTILESGYTIVQTDGSGNGSRTLDRAPIGVTSANIYQYIVGKYAYIVACNLTLYGGSGDSDTRITAQGVASTIYLNPSTTALTITVTGGAANQATYIYYNLVGIQESTPA